MNDRAAERMIPLPNPDTDRRVRKRWLKVLWGINPKARNVYGFRGRMLGRPGGSPPEVVSEADLRPDWRYPETPVVLEFLERSPDGTGGEARSYRLWKYDRTANQWSLLIEAPHREWINKVSDLALRSRLVGHCEGSDQAANRLGIEHPPKPHQKFEPKEIAVQMLGSLDAALCNCPAQQQELILRIVSREIRHRRRALAGK